MIDLQEGFIEEETQHIPGVVAELLSDRASEFDLILASKFFNPPDSPHRLLCDYHGMNCSPEVDLCSALSHDDLRIIEKETYSSLTDKAKLLLVQKQIKHVFLVGVDTEQCIMHTALDLFDGGYRPVILAEACASGSANGERMHQAALEILVRAIGDDQVVPHPYN